MSHGDHHHDWDRSEGRSGLGVRRPLRFLAHKLDLNEAQITEFARILNDLKTERAQVDVDDRRSLADFADAVAGEAFDASKATSAGATRRVESSYRHSRNPGPRPRANSRPAQPRTAAAARLPDPHRRAHPVEILNNRVFQPLGSLFGLL